MTADEFFGLVQIGVMVLAFLALFLVFIYLAYERPTAPAS
jgi:hypothetical protein